MKVVLTPTERDLLPNKANLAPKIREMLLKLDNKLVLEITEEESAEFMEHCTDALDSIGFDKNNEPTKDGLILDDLIDKFYW